METAVSIHHGPYESIPANASPGLRFLQNFLPAVDSLDPGDKPITSFFTPNAPILIGSNPPNAAGDATPLLEVRGRNLSHFHHQVHIAWDIDLRTDNPSHSISYATGTASNEARQELNLYAPLPGKIPMKRTVMFEATSETIFQNDPDQLPVRIREFNILDLEGRDEPDLQVVEMRVFMDPKPVQSHAASLSMASAYGEAQGTADPV
ncbi:uncharacterized protein N7459_006515 [Penicillium hispanicum]|uniref:uncharacterized protein n=1 Tax=Penicillium hispanicum TaxID=1080232 RepID=UPI002540EC50|nr:uncharacterized protein N7459_006515 [Penicillium hispanicum]KAJ5577551.1 hypothetical protein N7459_006515 [Penicillium hispanicum]